MDKLSKCKCGGKARYREKNNYCWIECGKKCGLKTGTYNKGYCTSENYEAERQVIMAWNRMVDK